MSREQTLYRVKPVVAAILPTIEILLFLVVGLVGVFLREQRS